MKRERKDKKRDVRVLLHNIRSTHNVGSIFRTADAGGVSHIYISGYTPSPLDQFKRKQKDIAKTALGAEDSVAWSKAGTLKKLIATLKIDGFSVVALEQSKKSVDYKKVELGEKVLLVVGNEVKGMSPELLKLADVVAEIPMRGEKESLNVSVAFGIALFQLLKI
ncbi:MAG: RNA methyltransferase [Candidatus Zambryskibacteria bacterium]|nr:RNA methyltransferase [Candidatus Zambryskibacteria bacterium]